MYCIYTFQLKIIIVQLTYPETGLSNKSMRITHSHLKVQNGQQSEYECLDKANENIEQLPDDIRYGNYIGGKQARYQSKHDSTREHVAKESEGQRYWFSYLLDHVNGQ